MVVTDKCMVVHVGAYSSKIGARKGLFRYLRECRDYDGREDLRAVRGWLTECEANSARVDKQ